MNKKGQQMLGAILVAFFGIIIALSLLSGAIIPTIGSSTTTATVVNQTLTLPAAGSTVDLNGKSASSVIVSNVTNTSAVVPATNYTVLNNQLNSAGELTAQLRSDGGRYAGGSVNVSYVTQPVGYISDSGGRTVALLIVVFSALAILVTAMVPSFRNGVLDMFGR